MSEDENDDDPEAPDESDCGDEDDPTIPCPYCRKPMHEESQICHHCGAFIDEETAPTRTSWIGWVLAVLLVLVLAGAVCWMMM